LELCPYTKPYETVSLIGVSNLQFVPAQANSEEESIEIKTIINLVFPEMNIDWLTAVTVV